MVNPGPPEPEGTFGTSVLDRGIALVRRVNQYLHYVAGLALVLLMAITVIDVVGRAAFNRPFSGTVELTQLAMVVVVYLGLGYAEHEGDHIAIDIVYDMVGRGVQLLLTVLGGVFGLVVIGLMTWHLYRFAEVLSGGGYTTSVLDIPQRPVVLIAAGGAAMFILALASTAVLALRAFRNARS